MTDPTSESFKEPARHLAEAIASGRLTVLTGAGISADSGVATFRGAGGLWEGHRVEDVATPEAFARNPELVYRFYNLRRRDLQAVEPNAGHRALARLESLMGERFTLITQNVDNLHERGGCERVLHMHGELLRGRCLGCGHVAEYAFDVELGPELACLGCGSGPVRPHIVWFGEMPFFMDREIPAALETDVFMSIGTSGRVYPAAGFVGLARANGAICIEVNLEPSEGATSFHHHLHGRAAELLPALLEATGQV